MKKFTVILTVIALLLTFIPVPTIAETANDNPVAVSLTPAEKAKADAVLLRLNEIKKLDKSNLSSTERKSLRKEVRSLKKEMKSSSHGVYLSVGAIIIIILLLILIL
jgi:hypothetical protein